MSQVELETELKFEIPPHARMPQLSGVGEVRHVGPARRMTQVATYYDTPDLALLEARHTLRRRTGGTDAGWHLKTPGGFDDSGAGDSRLEGAGAAEREEFQEPAGAAYSGVPMSLRARVEGIVGREGLLPVAVLRTVRVRRELSDANGRVIALLENDAVEASRPQGRGAAGDSATVAWNELEVELVDGDPAELGAIAAALEAAGFVQSDMPSKLSRALAGLGLQPGADAAIPESVTADQSGERHAVWRYLVAQIGVIQALEEGVLRDDSDAVHKTRVATRRLRATLRTVRPWLDKRQTQELRTRVRWLTRALADARDGEVVRERILAELDELPRIDVRGPVRRRMARSLDEAHARAHERAAAAIRSARFARLLDDLADFALDPPWAGAPTEAASLEELLDVTRDRVQKRAVHADEAQERSEREILLHEVRKKAKAARYAVEASLHDAIVANAPAATESSGSGAAGDDEPVGRGDEGPGPQADAPDADAGLGQWVDLQELLGEHQDAVVARATVRRVMRAAAAEGEDTYTYGVLVGRETQRLAVGDQLVERALQEALGAVGPGE